MPLETLLPHLHRRVASFGMAFFPLHASFGVADESLARLGTFDRAKVHVGRDDDSVLGMAGNGLVGPVQYVIGRIAFQVQVKKVETLGPNELETIGVVARNRRVGTVGME